MPSLFAHLVGRFAQHPENLAVEALAYVLNNSHHAAPALVAFASVAAPGVPQPSSWRTQVSGDEDATPDLVGADANQVPLIILEAKFWAGLTENQPVTYLKMLPTNRAAALLVVSPAVRLDSLWHELVQRASDLFTVEAVTHHGSEYRSASLGGTQVMALCSWRALLSQIAQSLSTAGDVASGADLAQLAALCEQMDTTAFLPLRSEELTGAIGSRMVHYIDLVTSAADAAKAQGIASAKSADGKSLNPSYGMYWSGVWLNLAGWTCLLRCSFPAWARSGATPIWLQVGTPGELPVALMESVLAPLAHRPGRVVPVLQPGYVDVAIELPIGAERHEVVAEMVRQLDAVRHLIAAQITATAETGDGESAPMSTT